MNRKILNNENALMAQNEFKPKHINYLITGSAIESLDGAPLDFSNMEISSIESKLTSFAKRNSESRKTKTN